MLRPERGDTVGGERELGFDCKDRSGAQTSNIGAGNQCLRRPVLQSVEPYSTV